MTHSAGLSGITGTSPVMTSWLDAEPVPGRRVVPIPVRIGLP